MAATLTSNYKKAKKNKEELIHHNGQIYTTDLVEFLVKHRIPINKIQPKGKKS